MNRWSLLRAFVPCSRAAATSTRPECKRTALEPLEDRKLLTASQTYVDDNWIEVGSETNPADGDLQIGDVVESGDATITGSYGNTAFGTVTNVGATSTLEGAGLIHDAITQTTAGGTVHILAGTFKESDIVIDKALTLDGNSQTGLNRSLIVPEVISAPTSQAPFAVNAHHGIIIKSVSVTIQDVTLDGTGNGALGAGLNYHSGITTTYGSISPFASQHNGLVTVSNLGGSHASVHTLVQNVTVKNVYWNGIAMAGTNGNTIEFVTVQNATVDNVAGATTATNRVGILLQNVDVGQVKNSSVNAAGIGISTTATGTLSFGNDNANARNHTGVIGNIVTGATARAYSITHADTIVDLSFIFDASKEFIGFDNNEASGFAPGNSAVGLFLSHSQPLVVGLRVVGAKTGVQIGNTTFTDNILPLFSGVTITGPGSGTAGSIGVLATGGTVSTPGPTADFVMLGASSISGFETGIKMEQLGGLSTAPTTAELDRVAISSVVTGISLGNGALLKGNISTTAPLIASGSATIDPGFRTNISMQISSGVFAPPDANVIGIGDTTLSSSAAFTPLLTGQPGTTPLFNFNNSATYTAELLPPIPVGGQTDTPYGTLWPESALLQDGSGQLIIGSPATNGPFVLAFGTKNHVDPGNPNNYILEPTDISNRNVLNVVAKTAAGNQAGIFLIGLVDINGIVNLWPVSFSSLNTTSFTTVSIDMSAPGIPLNLGGANAVFNMKKVIGYVIFGDEGLYNGQTNSAFRLTIDDMFASSVGTSQLDVTGAVTLGNGFIAPQLAAGYNPTSGTVFTVINNDASDAVSGTFGGLPNGGIVAGSGRNFTIAYNAGSNTNDVTLTVGGTNTAPVVDANGAAGGIDRTANWTIGGGPVAVSDITGTVTDDGSILTGMTVTISSAHADDVLAANTVGTNITATYSAGVLTMTGSDTKANYQTVLRSVTYNNTNISGPGSARTLTIVGDDGDLLSTGAVVTLNPVVANAAPSLDLDASGAGTGFTSTWTNAGAVNITDSDATITDTGNMTQLTATLAPNHANDVLSANNSAHPAITVSFSAGVLTLAGSAPVADYQDLLRTIKYNNTGGGPGSSPVTVDFVVTDDGASASNVTTATINIVINNPPALDLNGGGAGTGFTATWNNSAAVAIVGNASLTLTDDGANITGATATLAVNHLGDVLAANNSSAPAIGVTFAGGVLTLSGTATVAQYQGVLRTITYNNTVGTPGVTTFNVNIVANDGVNASNTAVSVVTVNGVISRKLFYNQSKFDTNNAAVTTADDAAIATDKVAYAPGSGAATFANVSSYTKGINGIMVDINSTHGVLTTADFKFRVGNNNTPGSWNAVAPVPTTITTRFGAGVGGSDRVEITWANNAIYKQWVEVIVTGNDVLGGSDLNTGLAKSNVFFFGNAPGDTGDGDTATRALVNATDEVAIRNHTLLAGAVVTNIYDIDRTGNVGATEQIFVRNNSTIAATAVQYLSVLAAGPFAPEEELADESSAVALALTMSNGNSMPIDNAPSHTGGFRSEREATHSRRTAIAAAIEQAFEQAGAARSQSVLVKQDLLDVVDDLLVDLLGRAKGRAGRVN